MKLLLNVLFAFELVGMMGFAIGGNALAHCTHTIFHEIGKPLTCGSVRPGIFIAGTIPVCLDSDPKGPEGPLAW